MAKRVRVVGLAAVAAAAVLGAGASAQAKTYYLSGVQLSDGTAVTGSFSVNVSGYPDGHDITTADGSISGYHYENNFNVAHNPTDAFITFFHAVPAYDGYLTLAFAHPLGAGGQKLLTGVGGPSLECDTYACGGISADDRYVVSGSLIVPEPGAWALMLAGLAAVGAALRRRRVLRPDALIQG